MMPAGHTVPPVGLPSQKTSFADCYNAFNSNIKVTNQEENDYQWESWGMEME